MSHESARIKVSRHPYADTVTQLSNAIANAGNRVFATIDQAAAAKSVGLTLRPTTLIVFGNPRGGTPLMDAAPLLALDLPLKLLVWEEDGTVNLAYVPMSAIASHYGVSGFETQVAAADHALDTLTNSVT